MFEKEIIDTGYKTLAKKYHPDKGGAAKDFRELLMARDHLINLLKQGGDADPVFRVNFPVAGSPPPIVPPQTVDEVLNTVNRIIDLFNKPKRKPRKRAV